MEAKPNKTQKQFIFIGKPIQDFFFFLITVDVQASFIQDLIKDEITLFWNQIAEIWVSLLVFFSTDSSTINQNINIAYKSPK